MTKHPPSLGYGAAGEWGMTSEGRRLNSRKLSESNDERATGVLSSAAELRPGVRVSSFLRH